MEKLQRNLNICEDFENFKSISWIAKHNKLSNTTVKEILIRKLGEKKFLKIKKDKVKMTAKRYGEKYLNSLTIMK